MGSMAGMSSLLGGGSDGRTRQVAGGGRTRPPAVTEPLVQVPSPTPGGAGSQPAIQLSDLQSIL